MVPGSEHIADQRIKRAIAGFEDQVEIREFDTLNKDVQREWGIADAVFVDNKEIRNGPPAPYSRIRKIIEKKAKKVMSGS